jgi:hypothetical protein
VAVGAAAAEEGETAVTEEEIEVTAAGRSEIGGD